MKLYAICNKEKKFYSKNGGNRWVENLEKAKIYEREGNAKSQITCLSKYYDIPMLVILDVNIIEIIPQDERVTASIKK